MKLYESALCSIRVAIKDPSHVNKTQLLEYECMILKILYPDLGLDTPKVTINQESSNYVHHYSRPVLLKLFI
jgi:hypothetical protein